MKDVLLPIRLDRWQSPVATLLREVASRTDHQFWSYSGPLTPEDVSRGGRLWERANVFRTTPARSGFRPFDIVHRASATPKNAIMGRLVRGGRGRATPFQVYTANTEHAGKYQRWHRLEIRRADVLVAVSRSVADVLAEQHGRQPDQIVPNGVDPDFFSSCACRPLKEELAALEPFALFVGVLGRLKRPDVILQVANRVPELNFLIAGQIGDEEFARRLLSTLPANVYYVGHIDRGTVRDLMAQARLLLFPSDLEGLPLTVLEALSLGTPVIAQPKSSLPEVIRSGDNGWLAPADDLDSWVDLTRELASWDEGTRRQFGKRARCDVLRRFSWDVVASAYGELYEAIG